MGRLRVKLLNIVTPTFDREKAKVLITNRLGVVPSKEILRAMEENYNRQAFIAAITQKGGNNDKNK